MSYENAPATKMLAAYCACCARPLVDAESVETGMGPVCRKSHGYARGQAEPDWKAVIAATDGLVALRELFPDTMSTLERAHACDAAWRLGGLETRRVANLIVHRIACAQEGPFVHQLTSALAALGYTKLAARITKRLAAVTIERVGGCLVVRTPYREEAVAIMRAVPGRRWSPPEHPKANVYPESSAKLVRDALRRAFPGVTASGPLGLFVI